MTFQSLCSGRSDDLGSLRHFGNLKFSERRARVNIFGLISAGGLGELWYISEKCTSLCAFVGKKFEGRKCMRREESICEM